MTSRASSQRDWDRAATQHSSSNYLLTVDTAAPHCMAFYWRGGAWQPLYDHPCSVGAPGTPTVKGNFRIGNRGYSFGRGYTAYWWTQFYGDYLFHSVLYNQGTLQVQDGRLGRHLSHGCVRMRYQDAKWIYDNVPRGTTVLVY
ncbi:L,D-transpeptidase [Actinomyces bovis]|uniref:L,D-transpeptidase n=1 Tax=Actinomyces bovis TaxID=1658 RepID=UPI0014739A24|nr:L,D-transpeptidase [Actinomyces bovis]